MGVSIADLGTAILAPFGDGVLTPTFSMSVTPGRLLPHKTTLVTFTGISTKWLTSTPILSPTGVAGVTTASLTVVDNTHFTVMVTTGTATGTLTWTDARYGITTTQSVSRGVHKWPFTKRYH